MKGQLPDWYDGSVGVGWRPILVDLHDALMTLTPRYTVAQVKEKFGGLRVYLYFDQEEDLSDENFFAAEAAIEAAEARSLVTCEHCGQPGQLNEDFYWIKTLCEPCGARRREDRTR